MTNLTEKWINIYKYKNSYWCGNPNHTKSEALLHLADTENYLTTVNIEQLLKLQEENTKLKELLKDCKRIIEIDEYVSITGAGRDILWDLLQDLKQVLGEE